MGKLGITLFLLFFYYTSSASRNSKSYTQDISVPATQLKDDSILCKPEKNKQKIKTKNKIIIIIKTSPHQSKPSPSVSKDRAVIGTGERFRIL